MNRRQLLKAIAALPAIKSVEVARLQPDDTIVVQAEDHLSHEQIVRIEHELRKVWPEPQKVLVLDRGLSLRVLRKDGVLQKDGQPQPFEDA